MTCGACPSQWEGRTTDGEYVYIRFRWGFLSAGIGPSLDDAIVPGASQRRGRTIYAEQVSDGLDGSMTTDRMLELTGLEMSCSD